MIDSGSERDGRLGVGVVVLGRSGFGSFFGPDGEEMSSFFFFLRGRGLGMSGFGSSSLGAGDDASFLFLLRGRDAGMSSLRPSGLGAEDEAISTFSVRVVGIVVCVLVVVD